MAEFQAAERGLPNNSEVHLAIGAIQRRQGKWVESTANLTKAVELSPNEVWPLQNLVFNQAMQRDYTAANKTIDRALKLEPGAFTIWELKAQVEMAEKGTFTIANRATDYLRSSPLGEGVKSRLACSIGQTLLLQKKYSEAVELLEGVNDAVLAKEPEGLDTKYGMIGLAKMLMHDEAGSREALLKSKELLEKGVREAPDDAKRHSRLAQVLACLGEKEAAIAEAKRATQLLPESVDAFDGPMATETLAQVYATVGESDKAIDLLDGLLSRPSQITVAILKLNPVWDKLRDNPRFTELLKKHGGSS
jgi:tetratricopeptide (TPR) repeat protein